MEEGVKEELEEEEGGGEKEVRERGGRFLTDSVEIGSETDVSLGGDVGDVLDVVGDDREGGVDSSGGDEVGSWRRRGRTRRGQRRSRRDGNADLARHTEVDHDDTIDLVLSLSDELEDPESEKARRERVDQQLLLDASRTSNLVEGSPIGNVPLQPRDESPGT